VSLNNAVETDLSLF